MSKNEDATKTPGSKKPWKPMTLKAVGNVKDLALGGGGKLTPAPGDPGDVRKPSGGG